jgi:methylglyoxal reductase
MQYRKLGSTEIDVSVVALGTWVMGGWMWGGSDEAESVAAIHAALDQGINLLDTAPMYGYGLAEEIVGRALRGRRDRAVLATKCGLLWDREEGVFFFHADAQGATLRPSQRKIYKCLRPDSIRRELEASLERLQTDHVDLYQTHWQDPSTPIEDTMAALEKLRDEGKIRAIGACNASVDDLKRYGPLHSDQEKYSLLDRKLDVNLEYCRQQNIAVLPYSPLANGLLTGKLRADREFGPGDLRRGNPRFSGKNIQRVNDLLASVQPIAARHQATLAQLVIAWTAAQPGVTSVLCGARNAQQALDNAAAGDLQLTPDEIATIGTTIV